LESGVDVIRSRSRNVLLLGLSDDDEANRLSFLASLHVLAVEMVVFSFFLHSAVYHCVFVLRSFLSDVWHFECSSVNAVGNNIESCHN